MLSSSSHLSLFLSLGGLGFGIVYIIILLHKMSTNKSLAFKGDKDASNHLILPCYRRVFYSLAIAFTLQFLFAMVIYLMVYVQQSIDEDLLMICIFCCAATLQIPYAMSPLLLWVPSLSRRGFRKVGMLLLPWFVISILLLVTLIVLRDNGGIRSILLWCLLLFTCLPSVSLSVGILSKKLSSRVEVRSRSSRSSTGFLFLYSVVVLCFGALYVFDKSSSIGSIGLGVGVLLNVLQPIMCYRTLNADTKFWRGLGKHNQGGIGATNSDTNTDSSEAMTLRVASKHLQSVMADLSALMIDFAYIEIGTIIGEGASACVYKAEYKQRKVAIKVLNPPEITEEELLSIRAETCINSIMSHPSIVAILGICVRPPDIGIVMEYCTKGTLKKSLATHAQEWTPLRRLQAAADLASAVAHVHSKGYMHRDIKAENLFVTDKWKIKLGDFGESRAIVKKNDPIDESERARDTEEWNQRMTVLGTVAYMAPELVNAEKVYTEAIDIYAMGVTFWEIWTGKDPFAQENTFSLYQLIVQGSRPDIPSDCPPGFKRVINDAWNTDAAQRPSALLIAQQLVAIINDYKTSGSALSAPKTKVDDVKKVDIGSVQMTSVNMNEGKERIDVTYDFPHTASEKNMDTSFQYDDMYTPAMTEERESESFSNPLKMLKKK